MFTKTTKPIEKRVKYPNLGINRQNGSMVHTYQPTKHKHLEIFFMEFAKSSHKSITIC